MRVLVGCEFSGTVRDAFAARGHDAWSCDFLPTERPGQHIQADIVDVISIGWDIAILHPPCTSLCVSGNHVYGLGKVRHSERLASISWTANLWLAAKKNCRVGCALENPVGVLHTCENMGKASQYIQPFDFGHDASKKTGLWLFNLPLLIPTKKVAHSYGCKCGCKFDNCMGKYGCPNWNGLSGPAKPVWGNQTASGQNNLPPSKNRAKERARTYEGIALAMAEQWGNIAL